MTLTASALATRISGLIFLPLVAHRAGARDLGALQLSTAIVSYFVAFVTFGMGPLIVRRMVQEPATASRLYYRVVGTRIILFAVSIPILAILFALTSYPSVVYVLLGILSVGILATPEIDSGNLVFQAQRRTLFTLGLTVVCSIVYIVFGLAALLGGFGVVGLAVASAGATALQAVLTLALVRARFFSFPRPRPGLAVRKLIRSATPFFLATSASLLIARVDVLLLSLTVPLQQVGLYTAGYVFLDVSFLVPNAIGQAIYPPLAAAHLEGRPHMQALTARFHLPMGVVTASMAAGVMTAAPAFVALLYGSKFALSATIVVLIFPSLVFVGFTSTVGRAVYAAGGQSWLVRATGAAAAFNAVGNLALDPVFGIKAAAVLTSLTYFLSAILHARAARHLECGVSFRAALVPWIVLLVGLGAGAASSPLPIPARTTLAVAAAALTGLTALRLSYSVNA